MSELAFDISLLEWQTRVWNGKTRFKVVAAGRRTGKSRLAANLLIYKALTCPTKTAKVFYIAPTQGQAKDILWDLVQEIAGDLVQGTHKNDLTITLKNGVTIALKGADRPQTMRGVSLWYCVMDEYADMKPGVWETIILPALSDNEGDALFIGTPMGRNHFYELYKSAETGIDEDFEAWHFTSYDNPYIKRSVIERAKTSMSSNNFHQEYMASFESMGGNIFKPEWITITDQPPTGGENYIAVDPAGFKSEGVSSTNSTRLDETAIAVVNVDGRGFWTVLDIIHGRWTLAETSDRIFGACLKYNPLRVGIERGIAQQALLPTLQDTMRKTGRFVNIELLTHGNARKIDRVTWALQGRLENEQIEFMEGDYLPHVIDQLSQFPNSKTHDDLVDALAYITQLAVVSYGDDYDYDDDGGDWQGEDLFEFGQSLMA